MCVSDDQQLNIKEAWTFDEILSGLALFRLTQLRNSLLPVEW